MPSEEQSTPPPWTYHPGAKGTEADPIISFVHPVLGKVAVIRGTLFWNEGDGPLIVTAVNERPSLLAVLKAAKAVVDGSFDEDGFPRRPAFAIDRLSAALAAYEEQTK